MGAHTISLAQFLVGDIEEVAGVQATVIGERPVPVGGSGYAAKADADAPRRAVENEDLTQAIVRFASGAIGTIGTSRIGTGRKLALGYEIHGTEGSLVYTQERMNEIQLYRRSDPEREQGFKTIYIGPEHPDYGAFFGLAGIGLGYNDQKIVEAHDLLVAVATGEPAFPDVHFAHEVNKVLDAIETASRERCWVRVDEFGDEAS
jgi:predicted dehydrogenase